MLAATYAIALGPPRGRELDATAQAELASLSATREIETFDDILDLVWLPLALAALLAGWYVLRGRRAAGLAALGVLAVTNVAAQGLTWALSEFDPLPERDSAELVFPSGHTAAAASVALAATMLVRGGGRWIVALASGAGVAAVGVASVAEGSHYPSDILGAYFLALAIAYLADGLLSRSLGGMTGPLAGAATLAGSAAMALALLSIGDGASPRELLDTGASGGLAAGVIILLGAGLPLAYLAVAGGGQPARNAALAAKKPHIPWTPPPGGVEDEHR